MWSCGHKPACSALLPLSTWVRVMPLPVLLVARAQVGGGRSFGKRFC